MTKPTISIIISYYKALGDLQLILKGLDRQSASDFEVIISEDDHNQETKDYLTAHAGDFSFPIRHNFQNKDLGFRKNMMLNRAITTARADLLVFIDGDCIPHIHFAKEYIKEKNSDEILIGRRVMLGPKISADIRNTASLSRLNLFSILLSDSKKVKDGIYSKLISSTTKTRGLVGCNWGIQKELLIDVNGYDEDYVKAGVGEDNDIEWRLIASDVSSKSMKNKAIVYHLYHPRSYSQNAITENMDLWKIKQKAGHIKCLNGLVKLNIQDDE